MLAVRLSKDLPIVLESDCFERANHSGLVPLGSMMFKDLGVDFGELSFPNYASIDLKQFQNDPLQPILVNNDVLLLPTFPPRANCWHRHG